MLNLTQQNFEKVKNLLLRQQQEVEDNLKALEVEDPVMDDGLAESTEPGTDSWLADTHGRVQAMKDNLLDMLENIKKALSKLHAGSYGKCEKCGNQIEAKRLEAMPAAKLCIACSKKAK